MTSNEARAKRARRILKRLDSTGDGAHTALVELLVDAMHMGGVLWVETALWNARDSYQEGTGERRSVDEVGP